MKRLAAVGILATAWPGLSIPVAQADVGGNVPCSGLCDYPGVGESGIIVGSLCDVEAAFDGVKFIGHETSAPYRHYGPSILAEIHRVSRSLTAMAA